VHTYTDFASALDFVHRAGGYQIGLHYNLTTVKQLRTVAPLDSFPNTVSHILRTRQDWKRDWGQPPLEIVVLPRERSLYAGAEKTFQRDFQLVELFERFLRARKLSGIVFSEALTFETNLELGLALHQHYFRGRNEGGRRLSEAQIARMTGH